jgi:AraC family transcriptional regulator of adaptative response / DNA-3-methyladenine glycosylase II
VIRVRLPFRPPLDAARLLGYLAARAIPGVEEISGGTYKRTIQLPNAPGFLSLHLIPAPGTGTRGAAPRETAAFVECDLELDDLRDVAAAVQRCRRLLDLDADPAAITELLSVDPVIGPLARACPGRRSPGHVDGSELALRAVLGQQVSVAAARTLGARLTVSYGKPLAAPRGGLTHLFPDATTIAAADPAALPMPRARATALAGLAAALASGDVPLHPGADWEQSTERLLALPGIGPWTASYIRMRALSDPDVFLPTDVGVLRALRSLPRQQLSPGGTTPRTPRYEPGGQANIPDPHSPGGTTPSGSDRSAFPGDTPGPPIRRPTATEAAALAESWRPWRSYALHHLWASLEQPLSEEAPTP